MLTLLLSVVPQSLDADSLPAWREHLLPQKQESRWQEIDWRPTVGDGLRAATGGDRPLLLWLMNGHPLGCT